MLEGLDGHAAAHEALLRALVPLLHAFYRRRMRGAEHEVDDLVQETLIAIHTRRSTYERDRAFTPWLYAIARYRLIDHMRRRKLTVPVEDVEAILVTEGFETAVSARMDVERLLSRLSSKQARAIRDTRLDGKSVAEAAADAGIGPSDVKVSVHRGLKALATRIRGE
ncbi:RNA polymerase sigma-70 factor (ECF subfamily) [Phenylobacterium koreense]|uniref:RNA polymerase sigma-70 factor (ECF subfamily) n=2 Tax=Caulobacteraceae TaxID=76892 RepID=A0ABV2EEX6_9CAUL